MRHWRISNGKRQFLGCVWLGLVAAAPPADDLDAFRSLYRGMVEINSTAANGSCTAVAELAQARLIAAGYSASSAEIIVPPNLPKDGNLVASLPGSNPNAPAILLLAHIDTVDAKPEDWKRDPFKLVEEGGYFHARGVIDDKSMAAILIDTLVRLKQEKFKPVATIRVALTCGEESGGRMRGVKYLLDHRPDTLKAAFAINEGGSGVLDDQGQPRSFGVEAGQKAYQDYTLVATGPGAHSSRPGDDNVITRMSAALTRLGGYRFDPRISDVTRQYFARSASFYPKPIGDDLRALGRGSDDALVIDRVARADPRWNAMIRTTCVATTMAAGHGRNALAQRAESNVNCRVLPGQPLEEIQQTLVNVLGDPTIEISLGSPVPPVGSAPTLSPLVLAPIEKIAGEIWPGVPVIPSVTPGATDGRFLTAAGIPTYGVTGLFVDPDGNGVHGLDERVRVKSLYDSRTFLYRLTKAYASRGPEHR